MKQISSKFSIAVHILSVIALSPQACTGDYIASSVNTNPVVIRRIMGQLKQAGLIEVRAGVGGAALLKPSEEISLLEIYRAVDVVEGNQLFSIHSEPNSRCPVGRNIEEALRSELSEAQKLMERRLAQVPLSRLLEKFR